MSEETQSPPTTPAPEAASPAETPSTTEAPPATPALNIENYASVLGDTSKYFISNDNHRAPLIVRHEDGIATHVIDSSGVAHAWDAGGREMVQSRAVAVGVQNPPGFTGFPQHEVNDPKYKLDNPAYAATLGDPAKFHVDFDGPEPRVVEHDTGEVKFTFKDGGLAPFVKPEPAPQTQG